MRPALAAAAAVLLVQLPRAFAQDAPAPAPAAPAPSPPAPPPTDPAAPAPEPAGPSSAMPPPAAPTPPAPVPADAAPAPLPEAAAPAPSTNKNVAWLLVGGALTFATAGTVLAYSTSSAEQDIKDLYASTTGYPPQFDAATKRRYDDLVDEGNRYQTLSYVAFGLAGVAAAGAAFYFWRASNESPPTIAPVVTPTSAGVRLSF